MEADLETLSFVLATGVLAFCGVAAYLMYRIRENIDNIKKDTRKLNDAFMRYAAPRVSTPKDMKALRELTETRKKYRL